MTWNFYMLVYYICGDLGKNLKNWFSFVSFEQSMKKKTCLNLGFIKQILMNMVEYIIFDMFSKIWCDSHLGDQGWKLVTNYHIKIDYMLIMYKKIVIWLHTWS